MPPPPGELNQDENFSPNSSLRLCKIEGEGEGGGWYFPRKNSPRSDRPASFSAALNLTHAFTTFSFDRSLRSLQNFFSAFQD